MTVAPQWLSELRSDTTDTRYIDWSAELGSDDEIVTIVGIDVSRLDGLPLVSGEDLTVTPFGFNPPSWIGPSESQLNSVVNFWEQAGAIAEQRGYLISVSIVTAAGRRLIGDAHQYVVPLLG